MTQNISLLRVLEKVQPVIEKEHIVVSCSELSVKLTKETFFTQLLKEYETLLKCEIEGHYSLRFDTDFEGCDGPYNDSLFVIQESEEKKEGKPLFSFVFAFPQEEEDEDSKKVIHEFTWEETKLWCDYVFCLDGRQKELLSLCDNVIKKNEQKQVNNALVSLHGISIHPNNHPRYNTVLIKDENSNSSIPIFVENLAIFRCSLISTDRQIWKIEDIYRDGDFLQLLWNEDYSVLLIQFIINEREASLITLSSNQAKELSKTIVSVFDFVAFI